MAHLGHFTRTETGFEGRFHALGIDEPLTFVPAEPLETENAPQYRILLGDQDGGQARFAATCKARVDRRVIGRMDALEPPLALACAQAAVRWNGTALTFHDNEARDIRSAIAVDDEAGDVGPDERRIEFGRQEPRHCERAGVPGNMSLKRVLIITERSIVFGNSV